LNTPEAIAGWHEVEFPKSVARIRALSREQLASIVDLFGFVQLPAVQFVGFSNNHIIHHRGQLSVYLRPMGGKVPSIYGGSADEPMQS
jgi:uncharacterized damage-inducible protein DinB